MATPPVSQASRAPDGGDARGMADAALERERVAERQLVESLRRGDEAAYEALVRRHSGPLLAATRRILRNEEDAREALQDAFLSAFRGIHGFAGEAKLSTWLHKVAINAALMKLRSRKQVREKPIDDLLPRFDDSGHDFVPTEPWSESADTLVSLQEKRTLVRELVNELPETYRVALLLRDIEELPTEEVARMLDVTPNAVKIRVHRARQALRALLDGRFRLASPDNASL